MKKYHFFIVTLLLSLSLQAKSALVIYPNFVALKYGENVEFSVTGNAGEMHWTVVKGNLSLARRALRAGVVMAGDLQILEGGTAVQYTAPFESGLYSVAATDGIEITTATVKVSELKESIILLNILGGDREITVEDQQALSLQASLSDLSQEYYTERAIWESNDITVVTISNTGLLTALTPGHAIVSARIGEQTAQIQIEVQPKDVLGLILTPSPIFLTQDRTQTLNIAKILRGGQQQAVKPNECTLQSDSEHVIVNDNAELQAISPGQAIIEVSCDDFSARVPAFVSLPFPLALNPSLFILGKGETKAFNISGGMPPYVVTATTGIVKGSSETWQYQAARLVGNDVITVVDQEGTKSVLNITVTTGLVLSPQSVDLSANMQTSFTATGGFAPYTWRISGGQLNSEEAQATYIAPNVQGVYEITVYDKQGQVKTAVINVDAGVMATPQQLMLNFEEEKQFQITGGAPPYLITVNAGTYTQEDDLYFYKPSSIAGDYQITVTDKDGESTNIAIIVKSSLKVSPQELFLLREEKTELNISGGYGHYSLTAKTGDVSEINGKVTYQASNIAGHDIITITDQAGIVEQVDVLVSSNGFFISPGESYVLPGEEVHLRGLGGTSPYTWTIKGEGELSNNEGERVTFIAPQVAGDYLISIKDNSGKETESRVVVYQGELKLTVEILLLNPGQTAELEALLGVPEYTWSVERGTLSATEGAIITYTAPTDADTDIIKLEDASGKVKTIRTIINTKVVRNFCESYAGSDNILDDAEIDKAITDFFQAESILQRIDLYLLVEQFSNGGC